MNLRGVIDGHIGEWTPVVSSGQEKFIFNQEEEMNEI